MIGWFTPEEIAAIREVAEIGMIDEVEIWRYATTSNAYGDSETEYQYTETVKGWLLAEPNLSIQDANYRLQISSVFRLFVPVGTDIQGADKLIINSAPYTVIDTNYESTWPAVMRCSVRKIT